MKSDVDKEVQFAHDHLQLKKIIDLRYLVLREPWNKSIESATDDLEDVSINAYVENDGTVIACGRLQNNGAGVGQIRYMAVHPDYQGCGLGKRILQSLEAKAKKIGLHTIELEARELALDFYLNQGYLNNGASFKLWDQIQHYRMKKDLNNYS